MDNVIANEIKIEIPPISSACPSGPISSACPSGPTTNLDAEYNTCCSKTKSSFLKFVSQLFVSLIILIYSLTMVALGRNDSVYYSLITLIIGVYIPTPKHEN